MSNFTIQDIEAANERLEETLETRADFQQSQDEEQRVQEYLDALYRVEQAGVNRLDVEQLAIGLGVLQYLHKQLR
jgi:C4-type Zn-finger protein